MLIIHNPLHSLHRGRQEMFRGRLVPCHEQPDRLEFILEELRARRQHELQAPGEADMAVVRRIHTTPYLDFLTNAWSEWVALDPANAELDVLPSIAPVRSFRTDVLPTNFAARVGRYSFDTGSPLMAGTWAAAQSGAACAIDAARAVARSSSGGRRAAMALTRPPGHHAGADFYGGYCFLNNSAIAAQALLDAGAKRVAVLDVDYHHGNGTQSIFYERADVLTVSLHGDPMTEYPFYLGYADETGAGAGAGWNLNLPMPGGTAFAVWKEALDAALRRISEGGAEALVVALGLDTFEGDPISSFKLTSADYLRMGEALAAAGLPTVFVTEGGYAARELGVNVANVLEGFEAC
ncbi:histone deacetylase family protein [Caenimonas sedimenti]|uniref:Histone deacetylase family protein n=1 Tax=Caenimonas sedimenti TaxID=2596921 RepID=A0A562ZYQ8_9BURK|nr:histone deacetylase family protein [Caenimonas sedimenti]TWO73404.1 histone deacetylase family protein [Caenimonas sedimenti]